MEFSDKSLKNENRSSGGKIKAKSIVALFFARHGVCMIVMRNLSITAK